mgnify:CR=1 FL=1
MGKHPDEYWTDDDRLIFSSVYARFTAAFHAQGGQELEVFISRGISFIFTSILL